MTRYVLRRVAMSFVTLFLVITIVFMAAFMARGAWMF